MLGGRIHDMSGTEAKDLFPDINDRNFQRALKISSTRGGTMTRVLQLAQQGFGPREIAYLTGLSYSAVTSSEKRLRKSHGQVIPDSLRGRAKKLEVALKNLPEDYESRQSLLDMMPFGFCRDHMEYFATTRHCLRASGVHAALNLDIASSILRDNRVASRVFLLGEKSRYGVIYVVDEGRAIESLSSVLSIINPS